MKGLRFVIIYQETEVNDLDDVAEKMVEMIWMMLLNELVRCGCRKMILMRLCWVFIERNKFGVDIMREGRGSLVWSSLLVLIG